MTYTSKLLPAFFLLIGVFIYGGSCSQPMLELPPNTIDLGTLGVSQIRYLGKGLNNHLQVTGDYEDFETHQRGIFIWSPEVGIQHHAVHDHHDIFANLSFDGISYLHANKISDQGVVVGNASVFYREGRNSTRGIQTAFRFSPASGLQLVDIDGMRTASTADINEQGVVVGSISKEGHFVSLGFLWDGKTLREFGHETDEKLQRSFFGCVGNPALKVVGARIDSINDSGDFAGALYLARKNPFSAKYHKLGWVGFFHDSDLHIIPNTLTVGDSILPVTITDNDTLFYGLPDDPIGSFTYSYFTWSPGTEAMAIPSLKNVTSVNNSNSILGTNDKGDYGIWHNEEFIPLPEYCGLSTKSAYSLTEGGNEIGALTGVDMNDSGHVLLNASFWFGSYPIVGIAATR